MSTFEAAWGHASGIAGWLTEGQARALYRAATNVARDEAIVEIGSHYGRSTVVIASAAEPGVRFVAVDPFDDPRWGGGPEALATFRDNVRAAGVADKVEQRRGLSFEAANQWTGPQIGLLYVDGAHDLASVLVDIDSWKSHLADGAHIYFHDAFSSPGTTQAIFQRFLARPGYRYVGSERSLAMFEHRSGLSVRDRFIGNLRMIGRLGYFMRNIAVKLAMRYGWKRVPPLLGWREEGYPY